MHPDVYYYLQEKPELLQYIRLHPIWYRYLSRDISLVTELEKEAKVFYGKTFPQRLEQFANQLKWSKLLIELLKDNEEPTEE